MIETLQAMLIRDEAEVLHAYPDSEGFWTIGVGRLIDQRKGGGISHDEAMYLLNNDISRVLSECKTSLRWFPSLDEPRQMVILNMVFNMGLEKFLEFKKTIQYIKLEEYENAAKEMLDSKWARQVKSRAIRLSAIMRIGELV